MLFENFINPLDNMGIYFTKYLKGITGIFIREGNCTCCRYAKELPHGDCSFEHLERGGSVVECLTGDQEAPGSSLTGVTALWSLSKTHLS